MKLLYNKLLIVSDNEFLVRTFHRLSSGISGVQVDYACSINNTTLLNNSLLPVKIIGLDIKTQYTDIVSKYDLIFSLHCKQIFPAELVSKVKCINVHPGYNPYNRGWFPQVFSILNKFPTGATIHEIDEKLDHGPIIAQQQIETFSWDTSIDIYNRVQQLEAVLLEEHLNAILAGKYQVIMPKQEGNVNMKKDFAELCKLNMNEPLTMGAAIDRLRALTHGNYANAFFIDEKTGSKVFVTISLSREK